MKSFKDTEIGREFLAGKCHLRVTKEGWAEFAKMCDEAEVGCICGEKVGSHVCNPWDNWEYFFVGGKTLHSHAGQETASRRVTDFSALCAEPEKPAPRFEVGDICRVIENSVYFEVGDVVQIKFFPDDNYPFATRLSDGRSGAICADRIRLNAPTAREIIITTDGTTTTARLIEGKTTIKTATATCSPDDTFDFDKGARLAFDRLVDDGKCRDLHVRVNVDTSAAKAAIQSLIDALKDLPSQVKVVRP